MREREGNSCPRGGPKTARPKASHVARDITADIYMSVNEELKQNIETMCFIHTANQRNLSSINSCQVYQ